MAVIKLFNNLDSSVTEVEVPCKFGRVEGDLTFPSDDSVSTLHGEFAVRGEDFYIIDLESTNGLYHNESQVLPNDESSLADDDLIEFGEQSFHIGISDAFQIENVQERYRDKKTEKIREKLNASKAERIRKIDSQIETLTKKQKQINEQLSEISKKYKTGLKGQKGLEQKKAVIDQSILNFAEIQNQHNKKLDDKKRDLYKRKTDLDDEIKLLQLSGESEEKLGQLKPELEKNKTELDNINTEKKEFPKKLDGLKKNQELMNKTIEETKNKLAKIKEVIDQHEKKYRPMLEKMDNQLEILKKEKERLSSDSTKTRQI